MNYSKRRRVNNVTEQQLRLSKLQALIKQQQQQQTIEKCANCRRNFKFTMSNGSICNICKSLSCNICTRRCYGLINKEEVKEEQGEQISRKRLPESEQDQLRTGCRRIICVFCTIEDDNQQICIDCHE
ncbi:hypothetical protein E3Q22_01797 [Wallemia mellicola]|uniref:Uncharacterized protein n=1 Tax=Wallemia mellicola TaxID=1708541 RepID=A0A4T0MC78_9BASI|nr:hypothetical protein E3Q22_01797 [Wallemia mellicola]